MPEYTESGKYKGLEHFELDPKEKIRLSIPDERQLTKRTLNYKQINPGESHGGNGGGNDGGRLHVTRAWKPKGRK